MCILLYKVLCVYFSLCIKKTIDTLLYISLYFPFSSALASSGVTISNLLLPHVPTPLLHRYLTFQFSSWFCYGFNSRMLFLSPNLPTYQHLLGLACPHLGGSVAFLILSIYISDESDNIKMIFRNLSSRIYYLPNFLSLVIGASFKFFLVFFLHSTHVRRFLPSFHLHSPYVTVQ